MKGVKDLTAEERLERKFTFSPFIPHGLGLKVEMGKIFHPSVLTEGTGRRVINKPINSSNLLREISYFLLARLR